MKKISVKNLPLTRENIPFERLFNPRAIVIIGVSKVNPSGATQYVYALKFAQFPNPIYLVNPKYPDEDLLGYKFYDSISSIPDEIPVDLAIIAVPAQITPSIIEELGKKGVSFAHIFSSGFSELDSEFQKKGKKIEEELIRMASKYGIRILGPNCMGIFAPKSKLTFIPSFRSMQEANNKNKENDSENFEGLEDLGDVINTGQVAFISQSGGIAFTHGMLSQSLGYSFSKMVSLGNQIDLDLLDFLRYFKDDPDTKVIAMYIENIKRDGNEFVRLLKETTLKKPVIIWKGGIFQTGHQAVMSHTGGLAGNYKMWESMARQTGIILVNNFLELTDMIQTCLTYPIPQTLGTAVLSMSGGTAVESTDEVERNGLTMPLLSQELTQKINQFIPEINSNLKNPLEFGGKNNMEHTIKIIEMLGEEPQFSSIIMASSPEFLIFRRGNSLDDYIKAISNALPPNSGKLLLCVASSMNMFEQGIKMNLEFRSRSLSNGFVAYRSTAAAAKSCYRWWKYGKYLEKREHT
ncbi:MAG: CoA-binding protein [Candidatus Lokiarchaeota archaeon]|nr:CoA-binding protein [Candidatus Lokiarchaeota archaeon]